MADPDRMLARLVALKRQQAEQRLWAAQQDLEATRTALTRLQSRLQAADGGEVSARLIAYRQGHVEKLVADIAAQQERVASRQAALEEARESLKKALHSENQLRREKG